MIARLLLILGALACAEQPEPQDATRPEEVRRLLQRGTLFLQQDRPARALAELAQAVALDSASSTAHFQKGLAHARLDQPTAAIAAFERALALTPDDSTLSSPKSIPARILPSPRCCETSTAT